MTTKSVLLDINFQAEGQIAAFRSALTGRTIYERENLDADPASLTDIAYAVVWKPQHGLLAKLPNLEAIFSLGAGVDHVLDDPDLPDVPLVRFVDPDLTGRMVEYVVLQVLMHLRQQRRYDELQHARTWRELPQPAAKEFRVGILGFGVLGRACATALIGLGFQVNGWSRSAKAMEGVQSFAGSAALDDFLGQTDILVSLLPFTDHTKGFLNKGLISKLAKDGPFGAPVIINAGRGGSQVEDDLIAALQSGALHGVSLDVFETEPLSEDSSLWGFSNAILTPHMAAVSAPEALASHVARQISRLERGEGLEHVVDRLQGY